MSKFIIKNNSDLSDAKALILIADVVSAGRVSDDGESFCCVTLFGNSDSDIKYSVCAKRNKSSDTFIISKGSTR